MSGQSTPVNSSDVVVLDMKNLSGSVQFRVTVDGDLQWKLLNGSTWFKICNIELLRGRSITDVTVNTQNKFVLTFSDLTTQVITISALEDAVLRATNAAIQALASAGAASAVAMGQATARPSSRPSFVEDFANSRFLNPRLTVARNSLATYVDKFGKIKTAQINKPRFHHDPLTKESLGLLLEETRTNYILYSQELTNAYWGKTSLSIVEGTKKFLDGTNAFVVTEDSTNTPKNFSGVIQAFEAGTTLATSLFVSRGAGNRHIRVELNTIDNVSSVKVYFDLDLKTYSTSSTVGSGQLVGIPKITQYDDDWLRVEFAGILDSTSTTGRVQVVMQQIPSGVAAYQGDGVSSLNITAVQVEKGLDATSIIKTSNLTVTRGTDTLTINGSLYQELFPNVSAGTLFLSAKKSPKRLAQTYRFYSRFLGVSSSISITDHATIPRVYSEIYKDSINSYNNTLFTVDYDTFFNHVFTWKTNSAKSFTNNIEGNYDSTIDVPTTLDQFVIGNEINTIIRQIAFWPRRMDDIELASLAANNLFGRNPKQSPTNADLSALAYMSPFALLRSTSRQEFSIDCTGSSITRNIRRPYAFTFEIVDSSGVTVTAQPSSSCVENTDNNLVITGAVGKTLTYAITPIFEY